MKITLAADWTDAKGKTSKADSTIDVDGAIGRNLIHRGLARTPATPTKSKAKTNSADNTAQKES